MLALLACEPRNVESKIPRKETVLTDQQVRSLLGKKIFFGHQSVGDNLVQGIRDLMATDPRLQIHIVTSAEPQTVAGAAFVEAHIGVNRNPGSKAAAFSEVLDKGFGKQGGIALYKYCYIDFNSTTDVSQVFDNYQKSVGELKRKYPLLILVHSTVPLTTEEQSARVKDRMKTTLRRMLGRDPNVKRNQFNRLLKQAYGGKGPIFDIAEIESTHSDGSRSYFSRGGLKIYTLAPEFTTDGGHLNEAGRRAGAEQLLALLARL
jgi:lysophospholipase L1-like esterase